MATFPPSPNPGDVWIADNGAAYTWDGTKWTATTAPQTHPYLPLSGGAMGGTIGFGANGIFDDSGYLTFGAVNADGSADIDNEYAWFNPGGIAFTVNTSMTVNGGTTSPALQVSGTFQAYTALLHSTDGSPALVLTDQVGWPTQQFNTPLAGAACGYIEGQRNGVRRWGMQLGSSEAESGGNVGSNFGLSRFDDSGNLIDYPFIVGRQNGNVTLTGALSTPSLITAGGANLTGNLTVTPSIGVAAAVIGGNMNAVLPSPVFGMVLGFNYSSGGGEGNFVNGYPGAGAGGFSFYQLTGTNTVVELMTVDKTGNFSASGLIEGSLFYANNGAFAAGTNSQGNIQIGSATSATTPFIDFMSTGTGAVGVRIISTAAGYLLFQNGATTTTMELTPTGLNATVIGATLPAAGTFTALNAQPTINPGIAGSGIVFQAGDSVAANSDPFMVSYLAGNSSGARGLFGFNAYYASNQTVTRINTTKNAWYFIHDVRDGAANGSLVLTVMSNVGTAGTAATFDTGGGFTAAGMVVCASNASFRIGSSGPTWTQGTGAPSSTQPVGSLFSRTDGAVGSTLYVSRGGGTWNAVAGV